MTDITTPPLPLSTRVTEGPRNGPRLYLVSASWRGGHDKRMFLLEKVYRTEAEAKAAWEPFTQEWHNRARGLAADFDSGFQRHPIRVFVEQDQAT